MVICAIMSRNKQGFARAATHSAGEIGRSVAVPLVDGLHHRYELRAAA